MLLLEQLYTDDDTNDADDADSDDDNDNNNDTCWTNQIR